MRSKNIGMASEKTVSKHLNVLEIAPEIGRANSKPLSTQGDNHFCFIHCRDGIKSGLSTPKFDAILKWPPKAPGVFPMSSLVFL